MRCLTTLGLGKVQSAINGQYQTCLRSQPARSRVHSGQNRYLGLLGAACKSRGSLRLQSTSVYQWSAAASITGGGAVVPPAQTGCFSPTSANPGQQKIATLCTRNNAFVFAAGLEAVTKFRARNQSGSVAAHWNLASALKKTSSDAFVVFLRDRVSVYPCRTAAKHHTN